MTQRWLVRITILILSLTFVEFVYAAETTLAHEETEVDQEVTRVEKIQAKEEAWDQQLKKTYNLTDEQLKTLHNSGLSSPQLAMVAQLAKSSNKPLEDVLKMRTEQKMGWGEIAKSLGVHPSEIGHAVRDLKHALRDQRKNERKAVREERKNIAKAEKEERKEQRGNGKGPHNK